MADDKKAALKYDWDSLPLAPDEDWDNIPLPEPVKPSSSFSSAKAENIAGPASGHSRQKPNPGINEKSPLYPKLARVGRAPVFADDLLGGLLSDEGGLNEDFDNLVDVSSDEVDDIDIGNVIAMPDESLTPAHPPARRMAGPVSPAARPGLFSSFASGQPSGGAAPRAKLPLKSRASFFKKAQQAASAKAEAGKCPQSFGPRLSDEPEEGRGDLEPRPETGSGRRGEIPADQADEKPGLKALSGGQALTAPVLGAAKKPLALAALVLLVLISLGFGGYRLFFAGGQETLRGRAAGPAMLPRAPEPGHINLAPFYISFPAEAGASESILEITFAIYYNDASGKDLLESRMLAVRDAIFNLASAKGGRLAGSKQARRELQAELLYQINEVVGGGNRLDSVKIDQVHILCPR